MWEVELPRLCSSLECHSAIPCDNPPLPDPVETPQRPIMPELPRGTVTFLFTDIEGSTRLWERDREGMRAAVDRHLALLDEAITTQCGVHFKTVGDAVQAAFTTAPTALAAAIDGQRTIIAEPWPEEIGPLRVRMGLHAGTAEPAAGDYLAPALNRLSRMLSAAHGGQILVSDAAAVSSGTTSRWG